MKTGWICKNVFTSSVIIVMSSKHSGRIKEQARLFAMMVMMIHGTH